jgi:hypothetical protein
MIATRSSQSDDKGNVVAYCTGQKETAINNQSHYEKKEIVIVAIQRYNTQLQSSSLF